ncbi:MAG: CofH family radical SAM protein [Planctomycetes bacterium]|nr:CofH family radical SAM protein [Planctomycetota bacterium]
MEHAQILCTARRGSGVILLPMQSRLYGILQGVESGTRLSADDALDVYLNAPLDALQRAAQAMRERHTPGQRASFLVDRNVNYTNVCITDCKFCEFYRPVGHAESYVLSREVMSAKLDELAAIGGSRVLLQGGHNPSLRLEWYLDLFRWMRARWPQLEIDALSPSEIEHVALLESMTTATVLQHMAQAGLGGVPGGGAEILDDTVRDVVSPKKTRTADWLRIMGEAQALGLYTSASQVFGLGETPQQRINALLAVRAHQDMALREHSLGFMAFVAWPLQFESRYGAVFGQGKGWELGSDGAGYLRHIAFCRVLLDNIPHFQASWPTMGLEVARDALHYGCDDMGGLMMEENVVSQAGSVHCNVTEEQMRAAIRQAGYEPVKRDSWYRLLQSTS